MLWFSRYDGSLPNSVRPVSYRVARRCVEQYHYLGYAPRISMVNLGVFSGKTLLGVMLFSHPTARHEEQSETFELTRMCLIDEAPKNSETRALSLAYRWLRMNTERKRLIAYADTAEGHEGIIYRAGGWHEIQRKDPVGHWDSRGNRRPTQGGAKIKFEKWITGKRRRTTT